MGGIRLLHVVVWPLGAWLGSKAILFSIARKLIEIDGRRARPSVWRKVEP